MKTTMIVLFAHWCPKCNMMMPIVDEVENEFSEKLKVQRIDVEQEPEMMEIYEVQIVPTFVVLKGETEIGRMAGLIGEEMFKERLTEILKRQ